VSALDMPEANKKSTSVGGLPDARFTSRQSVMSRSLAC